MFDIRLLSSGRIFKKKDLRRRTSLLCVYLFLRLFSRTKTFSQGGGNVRTTVLDGRLGQGPDRACMQLGGLQVCIGQGTYIRSMAGWIRACITSPGLTLVSEPRGGLRLWRKAGRSTLSSARSLAVQSLSLHHEEEEEACFLPLHLSLTSLQSGVKALYTEMAPQEHQAALVFCVRRYSKPGGARRSTSIKTSSEACYEVAGLF